MKNIPRLFIDKEITPAQLHYLTHVMRTDRFLAFWDGDEYDATLENSRMKILNKTNHADPSGKWTFCFAPIKRTEDLIAGVVQMGVGILQPVITDHTTARHINWPRMQKIIIENCEQSGRNSIPDLRAPIPFAQLDKTNLIYGDERQAGREQFPSFGGVPEGRGGCFNMHSALLIGPEGGFSPAEFASLDAAGATGLSLGQTILRAETAAIALCAITSRAPPSP